MADYANKNMLKVIVFELAGKEYAIPVKYVMSIQKMPYITRVPGVEPYVLGVINLKGTIIPILDLRGRFGLEQKVHDSSTRIIIVSYNQLEVGIVVDAAKAVLEFSEDIIEPQPKVIGIPETDFINGVAMLEKRLITLIKVERILQVSENAYMK